ncbi:MAG: hypothetical protein IKL32_06840 [Alphaproteobacteria bacterium]|nr:hypothetical protein [Alphaproteobacteria bacterium]
MIKKITSKKTTTKETNIKTKKTPVKSEDVSTNTKESSKKLTFWPAGTTREDKVSLFSFCLGMIVMTCFFVLDLQIRDYIYKQDSTTHLKVLTRQLHAERRARRHIPTCDCNQPHCPKAHIKKPVLKCPPVWQRQAIFNPTEYAPYDAQGTLTISGNICSALPKGAICPEKIDVFVNPKTSYSDEWWTKHWTGRHGISKVDERALKYNKQGTVQAGGQFTITNLPTGTYYVGAAACVSIAPDKPCHNMRWGTQISLNKNTEVSLNQVFPKK